MSAAGVGAVLQAVGKVVKFGGALYEGQLASTEAKYNARLKEQEAGLISFAKGVAAYQADRTIGLAMGTITQRIAKSGIEFSGSPIASMLDTTTQMEYDKLVEQYNLDWQKKAAEAESAQYYKKASQAKKMGWINAFSSLLS